MEGRQEIPKPISARAIRTRRAPPPSRTFGPPSPSVDWAPPPGRANPPLRGGDPPASGPRRGGVSAFGFGGTSFRVGVEEHIPGRHKARPKVFASAEVPGASGTSAASAPTTGVTASVDAPRKTPLRGALVLGGRDEADLLAQVQTHLAAAKAGPPPAPGAPGPALAHAPRPGPGRPCLTHISCAPAAPWRVWVVDG